MFQSIEGVVVKTVPRVIIQLLSGKEIVAPPKHYGFTVGTPVNVTIDVYRQKIGNVFPKSEGSSMYEPLTIF